MRYRVTVIPDSHTQNGLHVSPSDLYFPKDQPVYLHSRDTQYVPGRTCR